MFLKSFKIRITLLFTVIFLVCSIVLFVATYMIIAASLSNQAHSVLGSRLLEFWAIYQTGGIDLVKKELTLEHMSRDERIFMLRFAGRFNETLLLFVPPGWEEFDFRLLEATTADEHVIITVRNRDTREELMIASLSLPDGKILQIGISNARDYEILVQLRNTFFLILLPLAALAIAGGLFFSSRFLRPVRRLAATARHIISTGNIAMRVPRQTRGDELGELVDLFNSMLDRIQILVEGMRETIDTVAHDIRTPMTRLRAIAEDALKTPGKEDAIRALEQCIEETERVLKLLDSLLDLSRAQSGIMPLQKADIDMAPVLEDLADFYSYAASQKQIRFEKRISAPLHLHADVNRMRQVVSNLLENAFKYTESGSEVILEAALGDDGKVVVRVIDSGRGISPEELPLIWNRFYRSPGTGADPGFGLGLALVKAIVQAHGGSVSAESIPGKGSVFMVSLPTKSI